MIIEWLETQIDSLINEQALLRRKPIIFRRFYNPIQQ